MIILNQFQKLDDLIVEKTEPPVRTALRNQLALTREQVEAYQASADRQDETLARQAETIATLKDENKKLVATIEQLKTQNQPSSVLDGQVSQVLVAIAQSDMGATGPSLAEEFSLSTAKIDFILDELIRHRFVVQTRITPYEGAGWSATPEGRRYLVQQGLL